MNLSFSLFDQEHSGLAWHFRVSPSSCDNPGHYEEYIRFVALSDRRSGMGVTHVLIDADAGRIAGFVALRLSSLFYTGDDGKKRGSRRWRLQSWPLTRTTRKMASVLL